MPAVVYAVDTVLDVLTVDVVNDVGDVEVEADAVAPVIVTGVLRPTVDSDAVKYVQIKSNQMY